MNRFILKITFKLNRNIINSFHSNVNVAYVAVKAPRRYTGLEVHGPTSKGSHINGSFIAYHKKWRREAFIFEGKSAPVRVSTMWLCGIKNFQEDRSLQLHVLTWVSVNNVYEQEKQIVIWSYLNI